MSKLTEIENALMRIEPTAFQQFGDEYLYFAESGFPDIQRFGTQKGKMKSKKGHPDSYYRTADGMYVFIEYTTLKKDRTGERLLAKVKQDLLDCWSEEKTGVRRNQINRIIYCLNSNLSPALELKLENFALMEGIPLAISDIKTLDTLSNDVVNRFPWLAKKLGMTIDTEQILPISVFVREYQTSPFATPLNLPLVGRKKEMETLLEAFARYANTFVTGVPGTGKTRLVLEVLEQLQQLGTTKVYCLSDKQRPIYDDLRTHLLDVQPYLLFLDDGNYRILFLQQILQLLREERVHPVHLVITVRSSALAATQEQCRDYESTTVMIEKLDDDTVRSIVQGTPFQITHLFAINQILSIANGNPRLAVMAAQVAVDGNSMEPLLDVSGLYRRYFDRTIDTSVRQNVTQLRILGLLSFFRSINLAETVFCTRLFQNFGLDGVEVSAISQQLFRMELLDADHTLTSFRIGEQTLGAYFFYWTWIEKPLLDMGVLFREYFPAHTDRFKDMITAAYNTFGQEKVMNQLRPAMSVYWAAIKQDESLAIKYLNAFWYGQIDVLLHYIEQKIDRLPSPENLSFDYNADITSSRSGFGDPWLGLLAQGYPYNLPELDTFLELSLSYVRKMTGEYSRLFANLKQAFTLQREDDVVGYQRQQTLVNFFAFQGVEDELPVRTLLKLAPTMLRTNGQFSSWGRNRDEMRIHRVHFGLSEELKTLRDSIWQYISGLPPAYTPYIRAFIEDYRTAIREADSAIIAYDNNYLLLLFRQLLSSDSFADCCIVQQWIKTLSRMGITGPAIDAAKRYFSNTTYQLYRRLRTDQLNGVDQFELPYEIPVFNQLKEQEIRDACTFSNLGEFATFFEQYRIMGEWEGKQQQNWVVSALDIALEEMMKKGELGLAANRLIIEGANPSGYVPYRPVQWLVQQRSWETFDALYRLVKNAIFPNQPQWIEQMVGAIPQERLLLSNIDDLADAYRQPGWKGYAADLDSKRFIAIDPSSPARLLAAIEASNRDKKSEIKLLPQCVAALADSWAGDWNVLKATYLQQAQLAKYFDANYAALAKIVGQQPGFLAEYLEASTADWRSYRDQRGLGILWTVPTADQAMQEAFDYGLTEERGYRTKSFYPNLFTRIPEQEQERAYGFLCRYSSDNTNNTFKINVALDCMREGLAERLEAFVLYILSIQSEPAFFASLRWTQDSYILKGNSIVSEVKAEEYRKLLDILERAPGKRHRYAEHRAYLHQQIDELEKRASLERKIRFVHDFF